MSFEKFVAKSGRSGKKVGKSGNQKLSIKSSVGTTRATSSFVHSPTGGHQNNGIFK
jgi:hypothetical protein